MNLGKLKSFFPQIAVSALSPASFDEIWCRDWIYRNIHKSKEPCCQKCNLPVDEALLESFFAGKRLVCKRCRTWFDARTGTVLAGTSLKYSQIFCLAMLMAMGLPVKDIATRVGVNQSTVYQWKNNLSMAAPSDCSDGGHAGDLLMKGRGFSGQKNRKRESP